MNKYRIVKHHMLSERMGLALLDISGDWARDLPKTERGGYFHRKRFFQNVAIVDENLEFQETLFIKPKAGMDSYICQIEPREGHVFLVCFRGHRYLFDESSMTATYFDTYEKY